MTLSNFLKSWPFYTPAWQLFAPASPPETESESRAELDRFCDAMITIKLEINQVAEGTFSVEDNPLVGAPHTAAMVSADEWDHAYTRGQAAYPVDSLRESKYWPPVGRLDHVYGDRNLVCSCMPISDYE